MFKNIKQEAKLLAYSIMASYSESPGYLWTTMFPQGHNANIRFICRD